MKGKEQDIRIKIKYSSYLMRNQMHLIFIAFTLFLRMNLCTDIQTNIKFLIVDNIQGNNL